MSEGLVQLREMHPTNMTPGMWMQVCVPNEGDAESRDETWPFDGVEGARLAVEGVASTPAKLACEEFEV